MITNSKLLDFFGMDHWAPFTISPDNILRWQCGPLRLHAKRINDDWLIAKTYHDQCEYITHTEEFEHSPAGLNWQRYAMDDDSTRIQFLPTMPRTPLSVRTKTPIVIPPGSKILFYVHLPLWITPSLGNVATSFSAYSVPTVELSKTWYGEFTAGHLCYALKILARRRLEVIQYSPYRAVCPVTIHNDSDQILDCIQIYLKARYLSIFKASNDWLWTNGVDVRYHGTHQLSSIHYDSHPPEQASGATLLAKAPEKAPNNFFLKTFGF